MNRKRESSLLKQGNKRIKCYSIHSCDLFEKKGRGVLAQIGGGGSAKNKSASQGEGQEN